MIITGITIYQIIFPSPFCTPDAVGVGVVMVGAGVAFTAFSKSCNNSFALSTLINLYANVSEALLYG